MYESLHNHTKASDGKQTYAEVLATAERHNIGIVAFTDHDVLPTKDQLRELKAYQGAVKWCIGIELSTELPIELGGAKTGSMHMLGLFVDPENEALLAYIARIETGRYERMQRIVRRLNEIGFDLTEQDCLDESAGAGAGEPPHGDGAQGETVQ